MKIGILTGGGDCPGLNPVIRGIVRKANNEGHEVLGLRHGWKGLIEKETLPLDLNSISGILHRGGTILGTSRTNPYKSEDGAAKVKKGFKDLGLDALIAIGGEDTLGVATKLYKEGINVIGVPKTIDNDLGSTDFTFGFDTAVNVATDCIDRLHTTAESHDRVMVVEVMGRHAGWIAAYSGIAGGADYILIPEIAINLEDVCDSLKKRHKRGKNFSIVVVSEGAAFDESELCLQEKELDQFGHVRLGGIGNMLGNLLEEKTGFETRVTVLGHIQRGGTPSAFGRGLGTRFGIKAYDLVNEGKFGQMACLQGTEIVSVPLEEATAELKTLDLKLYELAKTFFG